MRLEFTGPFAADIPALDQWDLQPGDIVTDLQARLEQLPDQQPDLWRIPAADPPTSPED